MPNVSLESLYEEQIRHLFTCLDNAADNDEYDSRAEMLLKMSRQHLEYLKRDDDVNARKEDVKIKTDQGRQKDAELSIKRDEFKLEAEKAKTEKAKSEADIAITERKIALEEEKARIDEKKINADISLSERKLSFEESTEKAEEELKRGELNLKMDELTLKEKQFEQEKSAQESVEDNNKRELRAKKFETIAKIIIGVAEIGGKIGIAAISAYLAFAGYKFEYIDMGMKSSSTLKDMAKAGIDGLRG